MPFLPDSILDTTKKSLGLDADYDAFDVDIILLINSAFSTFNQLGIGPLAGFMIEDKNKLWSEFTQDDLKINSVKTLMFLKVKFVFDPPGTSFVLTAIENQIKELEWRLNAVVDNAPAPGSPSYNGGDATIWELEAPDVFPPEAKSGDLGIYVPTGDVWRKS